MQTTRHTEPDSTGPRLTRRGAATRGRILSAAARLMQESGVASTSLDDIMAASGTSKSQIYHYFAGKEELVNEVIRTQRDAVIGSQIEQLQALGTWEGLARWRDHIVEYVRSINGVGGCPLGSLSSELADKSETARQVALSCFDDWESYIADGLAEMQSAGLVAPEADSSELALAVMTALQGGLLLAQVAHDVRPLEISLDMALDHVRRHSMA